MEPPKTHIKIYFLRCPAKFCFMPTHWMKATPCLSPKFLKIISTIHHSLHLTTLATHPSPPRCAHRLPKIHHFPPPTNLQPYPYPPLFLPLSSLLIANQKQQLVLVSDNSCSTRPLSHLLSQTSSRRTTSLPESASPLYFLPRPTNF